MDLGNLFLVVLATSAPLLSTAHALNHPMAKPSTVWTNKVRLGLEVQPILTPSSQPEDYLSFGPAFAVGFVCASSTPACDVALFAVFLARTNTGGAFDPRVVWSANRDCPVRMNATLEFTVHGVLVLRDADGSHVWSSNNSGRSIASMLITETGNLVLIDHRNATVWQSFDNPTDTMVPGQSLMEGMTLTASTSAANTTENQLYITIRKDGVYFYAGSAPPQLYAAYTFSVSNLKKENDPTMVTFMNGNISIFVQSVMSGNITMPATKSAQFMRLESDGHLRLHEWVNAEWIMYDIMHMNDCAYPTVCGDYGICSEGQCTCPQQNYFKPVDKQTPNLGCAPTTPISCQEIRHHQLLAIPDISYFDKNPTIVNATSIDDCKQSCLKNCSCRAVMFSYYPNDSNGECEWVTEVFSLQSIQPGTIGYSSTAYLKVQVIPSNPNKAKVTLGATLGAIATLVLLVIAVTLYLQRKGKCEDKDEEFDLDQFPGMPTRFSLEKLTECTEGFSKKLGEGGFGSVFEGKLGEDRIAVKRLEGARQGKKEFLAEVETIGSIEHINLVNLIGFCAEKFERLLVYEYMPRGSLDRWIYYRHNNNPLDWCTRCRIILDIAKGLCYLHEECRRKIAHLDIKPQNILLDDNFNAKVADFGLCKLINRDQSKVVTVMRGTPGYLAPEWLTSRITEKVDVYSFGVVVMEIASGRKNIDNSGPEENVHLINLLREKAQNNQLVDLIDKHGDDMFSHREEVVQMMKLAIWCLQHDYIQRPSMSTVIKVLKGAITVETFNANSLMFVQDNPSTYSVPFQASILSGPR